jgi:hypothetical protein
MFVRRLHVPNTAYLVTSDTSVNHTYCEAQHQSLSHHLTNILWILVLPELNDCVVLLTTTLRPTIEIVAIPYNTGFMRSSSPCMINTWPTVTITHTWAVF